MPISISSSINGPQYTDSFCTLNNVQLIFTPSLSTLPEPFIGNLSVTQQFVSLYDKTSEILVTLDYPSILIHAISRGDNDTLVRKPCIYCQYKSQNPNDEEETVHELRIIPEQESQLDSIFTAICDGSALHPDPSEEDDDNEQEDSMEQGWITNENEMQMMTDQGRETMQRLESMLSNDSCPMEDIVDR